MYGSPLGPFFLFSFFLVNVFISGKGSYKGLCGILSTSGCRERGVKGARRT